MGKVETTQAGAGNRAGKVNCGPQAWRITEFGRKDASKDGGLHPEYRACVQDRRIRRIGSLSAGGTIQE